MAHRETEKTVNPVERVVVAGAGAALLAHGLRHRRASSIAETTLGAVLLARAAGPSGPPRGQGPVARALTTGDGRGAPADGVPEMAHSLTIDAPADDLYERFRSGRDLPVIWGHIAEIRDAPHGRTHWTVHGPAGTAWAWETELAEERDGERLRWRAIDGADLPTDGELVLRSAPGGRGTETELRIRVEPPGGAAGRAVMERLRLIPQDALATALRRWKALVETGEVPADTDRSGR